jgi:hypothetical protein
MSKEEKRGPLDGPVEVAGLKRNGEYHVVLRRRVAGKVEEEVLKSSPDKRIVADRLESFFLGCGL